MDFDYEVDRRRNLISVNIAGKCRVRDFQRLFVQLLEVNAAPGLRVLTDIREAELTEGSYDNVGAVESYADLFLDSCLPVKQAIVVSGPLNYGIARMYEALAEKDGYEVHVFDDQDRAEAWLLATA